MANFKESSRKEWNNSGPVSIEEINAGSLQRIATATELMSQNYLRLQNDVSYLSERNRGHMATIARMEKQIAAYKGHINRLKKQSGIVTVIPSNLNINTQL